MPIAVKRTESNKITYTLGEILNQEGVYEDAGNPEYIIIVHRSQDTDYYAVFVDLSMNPVYWEPIYEMSWKSSTFIKSQTVITFSN